MPIRELLKWGQVQLIEETRCSWEDLAKAAAVNTTVMDGRGGGKSAGATRSLETADRVPKWIPHRWPVAPKLKFNLPRSHKCSSYQDLWLNFVAEAVMKPPKAAQFTTSISTINLCPHRFHSNLLNLPYNIRTHLYVFAFSSALNEADCVLNQSPDAEMRGQNPSFEQAKNKRIHVCFSGEHLISYLTETNTTICKDEALAWEVLMKRKQ